MSGRDDGASQGKHTLKKEPYLSAHIRVETTTTIAQSGRYKVDNDNPLDCNQREKSGAGVSYRRLSSHAPCPPIGRCDSRQFLRIGGGSI